MAYGTATLTGTYQRPDGTPAQGYVEVIPNSRQIIDPAGDVILSGRAKVTLDAEGSFSVTLPATDDATLEPATGRQFALVAHLHHTRLSAVSGIELAAGATVDMADVTPAAEAEAVFSSWLTEAEYATDLAGKVDTTDPRLSDARTPLAHTHTVDEVTGVETPAGAQAKADAAEAAANAYTDTAVAGIGSGGGGAVSSVNGQIGDVTLDAADVGARPDSYVPAWGEVTGKPATFPPSTHTHDDRYYTETEVDTKLAGKAAATHTHATGDVTGLDAALAGKADVGAVGATLAGGATYPRAFLGATYAPSGTPSTIDGTTNSHLAFPQTLMLRNGRILVGYAASPEHAPNDAGATVLKYSDDGGATWVGPVTVMDSPTEDNRSVSFAQLDNGTVVALAYVRPDSTLGTIYSAIATSTDNGATWSAATAIPDGFGSYGVPSSLLRLPGNQLLAVFYGSDVEDTNYYVSFSLSKDGGATWERTAAIRPSSGGYAEATVVLMPDNELLCFMNDGVGYSKLYISRSRDFGRTWTTPRLLFSNRAGAPAAFLTSLEHLVIAYRNTSIASQPCAWAVSKDGGNTWTEQGNFSGSTYRYVYAGWIELTGGDLGIAYALEPVSNGANADVYWMTFARSIDGTGGTVALNRLDTTGGVNGYSIQLVSGVPQWAPTPTGGTGGGTTAGVAKSAKGAGTGNVTTNVATFSDITGMSVSIPAAEGDVLEIDFFGTISTDSANTTAQYRASVAGAEIHEGYQLIATASASFPTQHKTTHTVTAADIVSGSVAVKMRWARASGNGTLTLANVSGVTGRRPVMVVRNLGA